MTSARERFCDALLDEYTVAVAAACEDVEDAALAWARVYRGAGIAPGCRERQVRLLDRLLGAARRLGAVLTDWQVFRLQSARRPTFAGQDLCRRAVAVAETWDTAHRREAGAQLMAAALRFRRATAEGRA